MSVDRFERAGGLELQRGSQRVAGRQPQQAAPEPVPLSGFAHTAPPRSVRPSRGRRPVCCSVCGERERRHAFLHSPDASTQRIWAAMPRLGTVSPAAKSATAFSATLSPGRSEGICAAEARVQVPSYAKASWPLLWEACDASTRLLARKPRRVRCILADHPSHPQSRTRQVLNLVTHTAVPKALTATNCASTRTRSNIQGPAKPTQ